MPDMPTMMLREAEGRQPAADEQRRSAPILRPWQGPWRGGDSPPLVKDFAGL
jgi:hypothetical protein